MARVPASSPVPKAAKTSRTPVTIGPAGDDQHQDEGGRTGPGQGDHTGGDVDQSDQQVPEDGAGGAAAERPHRFEARRHEGVDGEQDDEGEDGDPRPGEGDDADAEGEQAPKDEGGAD